MPASAEVFVWPEGQIALFTGTGAASALIAYARNSQATLTHGWINRPNVSGLYQDHLTGRRADIAIQALYTWDATLIKLAEAETALHMKLWHNGVNGSAGLFIFSGRVDALALVGSEDAPYAFSLNYHANVWSAWGG